MYWNSCSFMQLFYFGLKQIPRGFDIVLNHLVLLEFVFKKYCKIPFILEISNLWFHYVIDMTKIMYNFKYYN